ncbi:MAG: hypothetical protein WBM41_16615 [Arenicellales bacterium]
MKTAYVNDPLFCRYDTETGHLERGAMLIPLLNMISTRECPQSTQKLKSKPANRKRNGIVHHLAYAFGNQKACDSGESLTDIPDKAVSTSSWDVCESGANLTSLH